MDNASSEDILSLLKKKKDALARQIFGSDEEDTKEPSSADQEIEIEDEPARSLPLKKAAALYAVKNDSIETKIKKSKAHSIYDSSDDEEDGEEFDDGFDNDLMGDEQDRKKLMAMTEVEREAVLFQRGMERQEKKERWELRRKLKEERTKTDVIKPKEVKEIPREVKESKQASFWEQMKTRSSEEEDIEIILPLLRNVQMKRDHFSRWAYFPFFLTQVPGLFVRSKIRDNVYQLHRIIKIIDLPKYYRVDNERFRYGYQYRWEGQTRTGTFLAISGTDVSENEYREWSRQEKSEPCTVSELKELGKRMEELDKRSSGPADAVHMMKEKKRLHLLKLNPTQERFSLLKDREMLLQMSQDDGLSLVHYTGSTADGKQLLSSDSDRKEELRRIDSRLMELEAILAQRDNRNDRSGSTEKDRLQQIALINKRNRELNFQRAHEAEMERKRFGAALQSSNVLDPTARRKTRSTFGDAIAASAGTDHVEENDKPLEADSVRTDARTPTSLEQFPGHQRITHAPEDVDDHSTLNDLDIDMDILKKKGDSSASTFRHKKHAKPSDNSLLERYKKEHGIF